MTGVRKRHHFIVRQGVRRRNCGHRHYSLKGARRCFQKSRAWRPRIYRVTEMLKWESFMSPIEEEAE